MLLILDHVLTTTYNNRPHLTTFFGDCFDDFNKRSNQLLFNSLIATNELTIIPTCHQHLSSRPRHPETSYKPDYQSYAGSLFYLPPYGHVESHIAGHHSAGCIGCCFLPKEAIVSVVAGPSQAPPGIRIESIYV